MKIKFILFVFVCVAVFTCTESLYATNTQEYDSTKTLSPYFLVDGDKSSIERFPLKDTKVKANINGSIAEIFVYQTFANEGTKPINATYVFPASTKASVHGMKMTIGHQIITAKIKERETAKKEFETAKKEGKSASLLEEHRPNVFTMSVANVMPQDVICIELHYTEIIVPTDRTYQFVFPTVVGPRYSNKSIEEGGDKDRFVQTPYLKNGESANTKFDISVDISSGLIVNNIACSSHEVEIMGNKTLNAKVTLANKEEFSGDRDFILNYSLNGDKIQSGLMLYEGEKENFFMLNIQPPERVNLTDIPPREYIFLLDVSGSMSGEPLDWSKMLMRNLILSLRNTDKFNLVLFAGSSKSMSHSSVPATKENVSLALNMIDREEGGGGTELIQGLKTALSTQRTENYSRSIIIITDGYIDCEKETFDLIKGNLNNTNFFSFGVGSSVNRYLIEGIAIAGWGEPFFLTESGEAEKICNEFRKYVNSPLLSEIKVVFDGFDAYSVEPKKISTLYASRPVMVLGKYKGEPKGNIKITGKTASGEFLQEISITDINSSKSNSGLSYLWARTRLSSISDYSESYENDDTKAEITALGLNYSILTPYTSFIAVSETIRNTKEQGEDVSQPLTLPNGVSNLAVGGYRHGSEPEVAILVVGMFIMISIAYIKRKRYLKV